MIGVFDRLRAFEPGAATLRMLLACLCGAVIGLERSVKNRPAGFITHILVCLGAALASSIGQYLYLILKLPSDISRISGQAISGLGFIGAGTIVITKKLTIKGLTTAAGLWTAGIIGLAVGSGYYELGLLGTALVLLAETVFALLGAKIQHHPEYTVELSYDEKNSLDNVLRLCKDHQMAIVNLRISSASEMRDEDQSEERYTAEVMLRGNVQCEALLEMIRQMTGAVYAVAL